MLGLLFLAFLLIPLIEIALFIQLGQVIGLGNTLLVVILTAAVGAHLAQREGTRAWTQMQASIAKGVPPGLQIAQAVLILAGGIMLLFPGFFTDFVGFLCLLPPTRMAIAKGIVAYVQKAIAEGRMKGEMQNGGFSMRMGGPGLRSPGGVDVGPTPGAPAEQPFPETTGRIIDVTSRPADED